MVSRLSRLVTTSGDVIVLDEDERSIELSLRRGSGARETAHTDALLSTQDAEDLADALLDLVRQRRSRPW